jgi:hypothetical protein
MGLRFSFLLFLQKKRNKEKGALSEVFFPIRKTVLETPRRRILRLLISELSSPILRIRMPTIKQANYYRSFYGFRIKYGMTKTLISNPSVLTSLSGHPTRGRQAPSSEGRSFWVLVKSWLPSSSS